MVAAGSTGGGEELNGEAARLSQKGLLIAEAATVEFLQNGYVGTSMDQIAARAAVSKQTVYNHFSDKEQLFIEIVLRAVGEFNEGYYAEIGKLVDSEDLEQELRQLSRRLLDAVMHPRLLALRRLVIGEAARFPKLGRAFYERGADRSVTELSRAFEQMASRGIVRCDDPRLAASHFNWLVLSVPLNEAMLCGEDRPYGPEQLEKFADEAVRVFLAAYPPSRTKTRRKATTRPASTSAGHA